MDQSKDMWKRGTQSEYIPKEDVASPTSSHEAKIITAMTKPKHQCDFMTAESQILFS